MTSDPPPAVPADLLRAIPWLADAPSAVVDDLAGAARSQRLRAGTVLYRQGDPSEDLAVVVSGRLRATSSGADGPRIDREIGRGEPVGEIGLLTGDLRAATVVAVRDTVVLRVGRDDVDTALAGSPGLGRGLVRVVAERLRHPTRGPTGVGSIALLPATASVDLGQAVTELAAAIGRQGAQVIVPGRDDGTEPADPVELHALVDRAERSGELAVIALDGRAAWWDAAAVRQVDVVLLVATAHVHPRVGPSAEALLADLAADGVSPRAELVLVHPAWTRLPSGTPAWMGAANTARVHHVRDRQPGGWDRLARHLLGRTIGLVLSGGGARAMAHLGAYRALVEAGVPIDRVGGSSIGGVLAVQIATGAPAEELIELDRREFQAADFGRRLTVPLISFFSIRRAVALFDRVFGAMDLSDTWAPSFVTTVDFTDCVPEVREQGHAATWARATASPPGLWPPVVDERGHLMLDGGVLDNLPVLAMQARGATTVIAVNVSSRRELVVAEMDASIRSWQDYVRRLAATRRPPTFPSVTTVMMRLGLVTSLAAQTVAVERADLCIEPRLADHTMVDYRRFDAIVEAGYRATALALEGNDIGRSHR